LHQMDPRSLRRKFVRSLKHSRSTLIFPLQALRLLPPTFVFPLSALVVTPYIPVPETNGEEWDRLEPASALDALVELAIHGEYNGSESSKRTKDSLELRAAAVAVFEVPSLGVA